MVEAILVFLRVTQANQDFQSVSLILTLKELI